MRGFIINLRLSLGTSDSGELDDRLDDRLGDRRPDTAVEGTWRAGCGRLRREYPLASPVFVAFAMINMRSQRRRAPNCQCKSFTSTVQLMLACKGCGELCCEAVLINSTSCVQHNACVVELEANARVKEVGTIGE